MRLAFVFLFSFILIGAFVGGLFVAYNNYLGVDIFETQTLNHLEAVAQSKANRVSAFLNERRADAIFLSEIEEVKVAFDKEILGDVESLKAVTRKVAEQTAIEVEKYLLDHPEITLEELQQDSEFKKIAIRRVGGEGYTVFYGPEEAVNYLHFNPEKTGEGHDHVWNNSVHAQLAKILSAANNTEEDVSGFYHLMERDDEREKYMYIRMIPGRYFDNNIKLSIKSTIYIDEFGETIKLASDLDKELEDFQDTKGYLDIILINPKGNIVWTADQKNDLGTNLEIGAYSDTNLAKVYRVAKSEFGVGISEPGYYEASGMVSVFITNPIFDVDPETYKKTLAGILALQIDNNQIKRLVASEVGIEESGEIYIVNRDRDHITPLMYEQMVHDEENPHRVSSEQIQNCFADYNNYYVSRAQGVKWVGRSGVYENYAGIDVLGAHQYILQSGWCILAEVEKKSLTLNHFNKLSLFEKFIAYAFIGLLIIILILVIIFDDNFQLRRRKSK